MGGLAANHAAEGDDAGVAAGLRERHGTERKLERAGHGHDGHGLAADADRVELGERRLEQPVRHVAVEACCDDADAAPGRARLALEQVDVVGNVQLAGRVAREPERGLCVVELVRRRVVVIAELVGLVFELVVVIGLVELVVVELGRGARHVFVAADDLVVVVALVAGPGLRCAHSSSNSNVSP